MPDIFDEVEVAPSPAKDIFDEEDSPAVIQRAGSGFGDLKESQRREEARDPSGYLRSEVGSYDNAEMAPSTPLGIGERIGQFFSPILGPTERQRSEAMIPFGKDKDGNQLYEYKPIGDRMTREAGMATPILPMPRFEAKEDDSKLTSVAKGVANTVSGLTGFIESPLGVMTAGIGAGGGAPARALSGAFSADMISHVPKQVDQMVNGEGLQSKVEGGLGAIMSTIFAAQVGKHAANKGPQITADEIREVQSYLDDRLREIEANPLSDIPGDAAPKVDLAPIEELPRTNRPQSPTEIISDRQKMTGDAERQRAWDEAKAALEAEGHTVILDEPLAPPSDKPFDLFPLEKPNEVAPTPEAPKAGPEAEARPAGEDPAQAGSAPEGAVQNEVGGIQLFPNDTLNFRSGEATPVSDITRVQKTTNDVGETVYLVSYRKGGEEFVGYTDNPAMEFHEKFTAKSDAPAPSWLTNMEEVLVKEADRRGLSDKIEEMSAQRLTASQIAARLGLTVEEKGLVYAVRNQRKIPSMEERTEFEDWISKREQKAQPKSEEDALSGLLANLKRAPEERPAQTTESTAPAEPAARPQAVESAASSETLKPLTLADKAKKEALETSIAQMREEMRNAREEGDTEAADHFERVLPSLDKKLEAYEGRPEPEAAKPPESIPTERPQSPTGIRNAVVDQERAKRGLPPRMEPLRKSFGKAWDEAMARMDKDPETGKKLVKELQENPRALTDVEDAILTHEQVTRQAAFDKAVDDVNSFPDNEAAVRALDEARNDVQAIYDAGQAAGTETGRGLAARKLMVNEDYSLARMEATTRAVANKGEPLTPAQAAEVKALHDRIAESEKQLAEFKAKEAQGEAQRTLDNLIRETRKGAREAKKTGSVQEFLDKQAEAARKRIRERRGKLNVTLDPLNIAGLADEAIIGASHLSRGLTKLADWSAKMLEEFGERIRPYLEPLFKESQKIHGEKVGPSPLEKAQTAAKEGKRIAPQDLFNLAREKVNQGIVELDPLMEALRKDLDPIFPGITAREIKDAFSGYGKVTYPSKAEDLTKLRELKNLARLSSATEDALRKQAPKKTGPQRDKPTQAVRDAMKRLKAAMDEAGIETRSPEEQLASTNAARKTALENQIQDLDRQLQTGVKTPKSGKSVPDSPDVERLRSLRDALKEKVREIDEAAKVPMSPEQKALNDALVSKERWEQILEGKASNAKPASRKAMSQLEEDVRLEIDAMKQMAKEIRDAAKPKTDPNAAKEKAQLKAIEKSIAEYERRVREVDFSTKGQQQGPPRSADLAKAQAARDAAKAAYDALKKANKPPVDENVVWLRNAKAALDRRTAELQRRVREGDYSKPVKKERTRDDEYLTKAMENQKAKEDYAKMLFESKLANRNAFEKTKGALTEALNASRALVTSVDLSAALRQGGFIGLAHPVRAGRAIPDMLKAFGSEKEAFRVNEEINSRPNAPLYKQSKLYLADQNTHLPSKMEEVYMSRWAKKIPGWGKLVKGSERAYTTFLNKLRADSFDAMERTLTTTGKATLEEAKAISNFINVATGRGSDVLNRMGTMPAAVFFSPRYVASRFQLMTGQPFFKGTARTRALVAKEYVRFLTGLAVVYALATAGQDEKDPVVSFDPRSSDFGKIRFGNTRLDPLMGISQNTVFLGREISGGTKNNKGKVLPIRGDNVPYKGTTGADVLSRFLRSKLSPIAGTAVNLAEGRNMVGEKATVGSEALNLVTPLSVRDLLPIMEEQGIPRGTALSILSIFGMGVQHYDANKAKN